MGPTPISRACWSGAALMNNELIKCGEAKKGISAAKRMKASWEASRPIAPSIAIRPERFLIVVEDNKPEFYYFEGLRRRINSTFHGEFIVLGACDVVDNAISLFEWAKKTVDTDLDGFTRVWIVCNKGDLSPHDFNEVLTLCAESSNASVKFRVAWTSESFELWYVLHFAYVDSALGRSEYSQIITRHLNAGGHGAYERSRADMFDVFEGNTLTAIMNAEKLEKSNAGYVLSDSKPGTTVHLLVKELLPYLGLQGGD